MLKTETKTNVNEIKTTASERLVKRQDDVLTKFKTFWSKYMRFMPATLQEIGSVHYVGTIEDLKRLRNEATSSSIFYPTAGGRFYDLEKVSPERMGEIAFSCLLHVTTGGSEPTRVYFWRNRNFSSHLRRAMFNKGERLHPNFKSICEYFGVERERSIVKISREVEKFQFDWNSEKYEKVSDITYEGNFAAFSFRFPGNRVNHIHIYCPDVKTDIPTERLEKVFTAEEIPSAVRTISSVFPKASLITEFNSEELLNSVLEEGGIESIFYHCHSNTGEPESFTPAEVIEYFKASNEAPQKFLFRIDDEEVGIFHLDEDAKIVMEELAKPVTPLQIQENVSCVLIAEEDKDD